MTMTPPRCLAMLICGGTLALSLPATALGAAPALSTAIPLDGDGWLLATDPQNVGATERWAAAPRPEAKPVSIPWTIQAVFPGYAGYAWYWREVDIPANPHPRGRYLLRCWDVDYVADVYLNGTHVGRHEGAQAQFTLDATPAVKPGAANRLAVRVLSLWGTMEGFARGQTPHGAYRDINAGGILDSVEMLIVPEVRIDDLFVRADPQTGQARIELAVNNAAAEPMPVTAMLSIAPDAGGEAVGSVTLDRTVPAGTSTISAAIPVARPRLWDLKEPYLYRLTARVRAAGTDSVAETSTRFGFRDFHFADGYFRLNGRRIFWRSTHTGADTPITIRVPYDRDLLRRDLINLKAMGFNAVRFISILGQRFQLDLCDEIGLMVYEESHASWMLEPSPQLAARMDASLTGMIRRDRNHPSVVMWGLLNETGDGPVFQQAAASLPLVRRLDDSRVVMLGSGRFDTMNFLNGLEMWAPADGFAPCVTHNSKPYGISCVTLWRPGEVAVIPGVNGEYGVVRWTAPADGRYALSCRFRGTGTYTTTSVHVLVGPQRRFDDYINLQGHGDACSWSEELNLTKGMAVDFAVGGRTPGGGAWYERWAQNTSLAIQVRAPDGHISDVGGDFSLAENPHGPWSYGHLAAGPAPDAASFTPFTAATTIHHESPGSLSNPGSDHWEDVLGDQHYYPRVPHRELELARLRTIAINDHPMFLSEYGVGSGVDLARFLRHHEQLGVTAGERLDLVKGEWAAFMADWERLKLAETFANPEDFFRRCVARQASLKTIGIDAIRSNPRIVAYGMTGCNDPLEFGEGQFTAFRELKPGTTDALFEAFAPVHWCTFAEPPSGYRGAKVRLEAVLANEDAAPPGSYPARVQVVGPSNQTILDRTITVTIPGHSDGHEPPMALPVFSEDVPIDGPTGQYRFLITFQQGVAATGGDKSFYVTDPADMPPVGTPVAMWGQDAELALWLKEHHIDIAGHVPGVPGKREVILVSFPPSDGDTPQMWRDIATRIARGSTAVFLVPEVFARDDQPLGWLPRAHKGTLAMVSEYTFPQVYPRDEWARRHPLFDGLPCGGLMDYAFYRELIPDFRFADQPTPAEAVAGSFRTSHPGAYSCELMLSVEEFGAGRIILNSLRVRQTLGEDPIAERLLRNMLRYAARDLDQPPVELPADFADTLKAIGY